ncbi:MAG: DUF3822 family protein [Bacteroidales bacterium]|nr:DUF3822 family protein [Bacteroidales bacterium]
MPFLEFFDETLDINSTENYELSVQVSPDGLSFCLLDTIRNKFVLIRSSEPEENKYFNSDKINELIGKDDFLTKRYKKVKLLMPSKKYTIVPSPLFDPGKKEEYFTFNHNNEEGNPIMVNKLENPDAYLVFSVSRPILTLANTYFKGVHPYHHLKPLLEHISHISKTVNHNYIQIHIERDFFNLIVFNSNVLKFCNTFNYRNISDILYYVLNVFRKMDIKQEETINFSGLTEKYDDLSSTFSMYVRNIKFSEPSGNFTFSYVFNEMELHQFLNLFNVVNCE